jgi:Kef-type K+ transport system membrane component KefB
MPELSLAGVVLVAAVAFAVPLFLGLSPRLRLPSVVLEIVVGIVLGPSVLGWVQVDLPVQVLSLLGLAFLLFLAGLEIDVHELRGSLLGVVAAGFGCRSRSGLPCPAVWPRSGWWTPRCWSPSSSPPPPWGW